MRPRSISSGKPASEVLHLFDPVPQLLRNVRFTGGKPLENETVREVIAEAESELAGKGRLVIRPSGTEPVIRVMVEAKDRASALRWAQVIANEVKEAS